MEDVLSAPGDGDRSRLSSSSRFQDLVHKTGVNPLLQAKRKRKGPGFCVFCKNNEESREVYSSHVLKDESGRVVCPVLYAYECEICGATGEDAHTVKHCPRDEAKLNKQRLLNEKWAAMARRSNGNGSSVFAPQRRQLLCPSMVNDIIIFRNNDNDNEDDDDDDCDYDYDFYDHRGFIHLLLSPLKEYIHNEDIFVQNLLSLAQCERV